MAGFDFRQLMSRIQNPEVPVKQDPLDESSNFMSQFLRDRLRDPSSATDPARDAGRKKFGRARRRGLRDIKEFGAQSGMRGTGANFVNQLFESETGAIGGLESDLALIDEQTRRSSIDDLLGLRGQNIGREQFGQDLDFRNKRLEEMRRQFDESQGFNFGDFLGNLVGGGAQIGAAALSDKKTKKNIKYTGEKTRDGIPLAEFKYKGDNRKFKGVIAQDVEKVKPSAVFKVVDYSKLPDAIFEEVA